MVHFAYQRSSQRAGTLPIIQSRLRHSLTEFKLRVHLLDAHSKRVDLPLQARNYRFGPVPRSSRLKTNGSQSRGYRRPRGALPELLDHFWNNVSGAVDLRVSVEPAKGKAQTPSRAIGAWIHRPQNVRSLM